MRPAIRVENLSKRYKLGLTHAGSIRELAARATDRLLRRKAVPPSLDLAKVNGSAENADENGDFWALRDVSFEVQPGEILGIIGRNGAGKSTLLKILSRITTPTSGRVEINGRVASLLEVGTGFHPELTGRENVYLNGTILGMTKAEIRRKFDEIVAFAEIDQFIDTPVKRYSSGMYVRLAFAVAAHLDPEILIVDEVLAVGDATFQTKCLQTMAGVARSGRTVLFVSHNLRAVRSLCVSAIEISEGYIRSSGSTSDAIAAYLGETTELQSEATWSYRTAPGTSELKLLAVRTFSHDSVRGPYRSSEPICIELEFETRMLHPALCVGFDLMASDGVVVLRSYQTDLPAHEWPGLEMGRNRWLCTIPAALLNGGAYYVCPRIGLHNMSWIVHIDSAVRFEVLLTHGHSPMWNGSGDRIGTGAIAPVLEWRPAPEVSR
jgi:lipopolysaccharide transport system ATP-binding protein